MSIQFNDVTNYKGLVQFYEKKLGFPRGFVSGDTDRLKEFTADVNVAIDDFMALAIPASGTWQYDDTSTLESDGITTRKYPIIKANLILGQRDYTFTADQQGNLILDIFKVMILPSATSVLYQEIYPIDAQASGDWSDISTENTATGTPYQYDKTANGIILDKLPSYNATLGLKIYVNREGSYFLYTDTTKLPGVPGILHAYFFLNPALNYAQRNSLAIAGGRLRNGAFTGMLSEVNEFEKRITDYFGQREKDKQNLMQNEPIIFI